MGVKGKTVKGCFKWSKTIPWSVIKPAWNDPGPISGGSTRARVFCHFVFFSFFFLSFKGANIKPTWKDPGPISGGSTRSLVFSRHTDRCLSEKVLSQLFTCFIHGIPSWQINFHFRKKNLSSTVGQIAVGGRTWSWNIWLQFENLQKANRK